MLCFVWFRHGSVGGQKVQRKIRGCLTKSLLCDFCGNWSFPDSLASSMKQKLLHWDKMASPRNTQKEKKQWKFYFQTNNYSLFPVHMSFKRCYNFDMKRKFCLSEVITLNWYYLQIICKSLMKEKQKVGWKYSKVIYLVARITKC